MSAKNLSKKRVWDGFYALDVIAFDTKRINGEGYLPSTQREIFVTGDVSLLLPYNPQTDEVVLVEQFRIVPHMMGEQNAFSLECPGGLVDDGEDPATAARREAMEEAGVKVSDIKKVNTVYPCPGSVIERFNLFVGRMDETISGSFGLIEEGEETRNHVMKAQEAIAMADRGGIYSASTALLLNWLARNRDELRKEWS